MARKPPRSELFPATEGGAEADTKEGHASRGSENNSIEMDEASFREVVEVFELLWQWELERHREGGSK